MGFYFKSMYSMLIFFYFLVMFMFISFNSIFLFWILLEINIIFFVMIILFSNFKEFFLSAESCMYYFCLQTMSSFIFLNFFIFTYSDFFFYKSFNIKDFMLLMSLFFKLGVFPFSFWMFEIIKMINSNSFCFLLTFQKLPIFLIFNMMMMKCFFFFFLIIMFIGSMYMFMSFNLKNLLVSSSIYNMFWFYVAIFFNFFYFLIFFVAYTVTIFIFKEMKLLNYNFYKKSYLMSIIMSLILLFFFSLPPFGMFYMKYMIIMSSLVNLDIFYMLSIFVTIFASLVGYMYFFYNVFFVNLNFFNYNMINIKLFLSVFMICMFIFHY